MFRWISVTVLLSASAVACVWMLFPHTSPASLTSSVTDNDTPETKKSVPQRREKAPPPSRPSSVSTGPRGQPQIYVYPKVNSSLLTEPIIISDCPLVIVEKQEVPSEKEGVLLFIGTEVLEGEIVPPDKQLPVCQLGFLAINVGEKPVEGENCFQIAGNTRDYFRKARATEPFDPEKTTLLTTPKGVRKLQVGDRVQRGQLLAQVNPAKSQDDVMVKIAKLNAVERQRVAAWKTMREYARRLANYYDINRRQPGTIQADQLMETELQRVKAEQEESVKRAEIAEAQSTLRAALTDLKMHAIHSAIDGIVKAIYKNHQGDAVKPYEAILRIENPSRLRVEGRLEVQEALKLKEGMKAIIEASRPESPKLVLNGHRDQVNCVAVSKGKRPVIVSGGDDEYLFGWDSVSGDKLWTVWGLHSAVRSVACSPPGSKQNLACFGCFDGTVRLLNLDNPQGEKPRDLTERHRGPVLSIAFSPDGEIIATCGDDKLIRLWKTATGELLRIITGKHAAPITSVQFASSKLLVSAGKDNRLIVWDIEDISRPRDVGAIFDRRGGEVATLGVSPDGKNVLFDQGKELQLLTLDHQHLVGALQDFSAPMNFSTMALFSPDGKTILTNRSIPGKLQLWRTPAAETRRGSELRQFAWMKGVATCGAFAPEDGSFAVTGTQDHKVLVWQMPGKEEIDSRLEAPLMLVEKYIDTQNRDVRVWAELDAPEWLIPGMRATMVVLPQKK